MFIDDQKKQVEDNYYYQSKIDAPPGNRLVFIVVGIVAFGILASVIYFKVFSEGQKKNTPAVADQNTASSSVNKLPVFSDDSSDTDDFGLAGTNLTAENISFGYFYKEPQADFSSTIASYGLPGNVKTDVKNYHDISRKIDLDPYLDHLNNLGFAVLTASKDPAGKDFFQSYRTLSEKNIPILITTDFIFYYYQNTLKNVYKEIEKSVFYDHVWNINKSLYEIALTRYKATYGKIGPVNDPVLEGQRLELAYFATGLKLMMPTAEQLANDGNFSNPDKFNPSEADKYGLPLPDYLSEDIAAEVALIRKADKVAKSPIMLYESDYSRFALPENYQGNAKLTNFYLALQWLKTPFPLYHKTDICENCLLDRDDWIINFYAANSIASDIANSQELKNRWAIVYKFISFFNGLRQDLTYLNYHKVLTDLFGPQYSMEKIFSLENAGRDDDILKIQGEIAKLDFPMIEGGFDRKSEASLPVQGMRILQESYWPNDYVFQMLSGEEIMNNEKLDREALKTGCQTGKGGYYRCRGFGLDIINLIYGVGNDNLFFQKNTNYPAYAGIVSGIKKEIDSFNSNTWNNNVYWVALDNIKEILENKVNQKPVYMESPEWKNEKSYITAQGAWVDLHLQQDMIVSYADNDSGGTGLGLYGKTCNMDNYVETNYYFVEELIARSNMLVEMLKVLKVNQDTNAASIELKDLNSKLKSLSAIIKKELNNQGISTDECRLLEDLTLHHKVVSRAKKTFTVNSSSKPSSHTINGVKFLGLIYKKNADNILVFGPMYDYAE